MSTTVKALNVMPALAAGGGGMYDIDWVVESSDTSSPTFMVQVGQTEVGPWADLLTAKTSQTSVSGVGPKRLSFQEEFFYHLQVFSGSTLLATSGGVQADFVTNKHDFLIYREMLRREELGLRKYNGLPGLLLRRIIYGVKCTDCTDETLGEGDQASNECPNCYGTGFVGGYYPPVQMFVDWADDPPSANNTSLETDGPSETRMTEFVCAARPDMKFDDIFIDLATGQRHEVVKVETDSFKGSTIRQVVSVSRLPLSDPAYKVPAPYTKPPQVTQTLSWS